MKLSTTLFPLLFAALTTALSIGGGQQVLQTSVGKPKGPKVPGENPLYFCGPQDNSILAVAKLDLGPNPPEAGKNLTITASGTLKEAILKGAYVELAVTYRYIKIVNQVVDLCEQVKHLDLKCPIGPGKIEIFKIVSLPSAIPPGKYDVSAHVYNADNKEITSMEASVVFSS